MKSVLHTKLCKNVCVQDGGCLCQLSVLLPLFLFISSSLLGEWLSPDFSQCRLKAGTAPFVLLWITFQSTYTRHWQDSYTGRTISEVCWEAMCECLHV